MFEILCGAGSDAAAFNHSIKFEVNYPNLVLPRPVQRMLEVRMLQFCHGLDWNLMLGSASKPDISSGNSLRDLARLDSPISGECSSLPSLCSRRDSYLSLP